MNENEIITFLRAKAQEYNIPGLVLGITSDGDSRPFNAGVPSPGKKWVSEYGFGNTIAEAVADLLPKIKTARQVAAELRKQADEIEASQ